MGDKDLVDMLREIALDEKTSWDGWNAQDVATVESAADAIERLTAEVAELKAYISELSMSLADRE